MRVRPWVLLICLCVLPACTPLYILRAGYEEAKILWYRRPIADILRQPGPLDLSTQEKLRLVLRVRTFAEQDLGFRVGGSYGSLSELPSPPTIYVITAAHRTRLEAYTWWFPIVGRVSYKGYFDSAQADAEARRLETQGFDTYMRTAAAFSTLGWFADPLLPQLLGYDGATLANIVLHELFHNTFYLSGQTAFNESLANFAGYRGALAFFVKTHGETHALTRHLQDRLGKGVGRFPFSRTGPAAPDRAIRLGLARSGKADPAKRRIHPAPGRISPTARGCCANLRLCLRPTQQRGHSALSDLS